MDSNLHKVSPSKYVLRRLKKDRLRLALAIFWSILFVIVPMQIPVLTGILVDQIGRNQVQPTNSMRILGIIDLTSLTRENVVNSAIIGLAIVAVLYGVSAFFRTLTLAKLSSRFVARLQKSLVEKAEFLSLDVHSKYGSADLLNRAILDTQSLRLFIENSIIKTIVKVTQMAFPLAMLFIIDPFLAMLAASILPLQFVINQRLQKKLYQNSRKGRKVRARLTSAIKEGFDSIESIQTAKAESYSLDKIFDLTERVEDNQIISQKLSAMVLGIVWALTTIGLALVWWQGSAKVLAGQLSIGSLVAFTGFALLLYQPSRSFTKSVNLYHKGIVAAERIQEILDKQSSIKDSRSAIDAELNNAEIVFENVRFAYPRRSATKDETLKDVSFCIHSNTLTVIVGRNGSGKSTILKLLTRLFDADEGKIGINGRDIREIKLESLRSQIAVVPQSPVIFSDTVFENVALGVEDASEVTVRQACDLANATEFIESLKKGFETKLGQRGTTLSGGQAQRIAIARALIRRPKILLLDEPNSSLDSKSEASMISTLITLKKQMTIIIVSHDIHSLIGVADRIIVLDDGKILKNGTHQELVAQPGMYDTLSGESSEHDF